MMVCNCCWRGGRGLEDLTKWAEEAITSGEDKKYARDVGTEGGGGGVELAVKEQEKLAMPKANKLDGQSCGSSWGYNTGILRLW